ncbi:MAG TPA: hypothetical protein VFV67_27310 [Actinophytocola sp.]|uniref:hypothetical protein n=1 Tax=Actinophytocola sp. TaxID=1872138 RepID=UPI002DB67B65|nr:hypothetical protein [Actinophytocola sp.]HEU5474373.1 hypothetical protein [Actinophytocola sp.]
MASAPPEKGQLAGTGFFRLWVLLIVAFIVGAPVTMLVDSVSYLVSSAALATLPRARPEHDRKAVDRTSDP